jgi:hypothetical protein
MPEAQHKGRHYCKRSIAIGEKESTTTTSIVLYISSTIQLLLY